jgi:Ser/Thr protein kinase RdoA (MazF antagonist)
MAILTELHTEDFHIILQNYDLGEYKSHRHIPCALGNTIYELETTKGKFITKVFESADQEFFEYQMKLMNAAWRHKLPVPMYYKLKNGASSFKFDGKITTIQQFVQGRHPRKISRKLLVDIAQNQAKLNKAFMEIPLENKYNWSGDYHFRHIEFNVLEYGKFNIRNEEDEILESLKTINREQLRKSNVHGDFHSVNLLVENDELKAIIDWDDAHEDYLIHDTFCMIAHTFVKEKKIYSNQIRTYLSEFQKYIKFNDEELRAMYYFILQRYLAAISYHVRFIDEHPEMAKYIKKIIKMDIDKYKNFKNFSIKDFLKLT